MPTQDIVTAEVCLDPIEALVNLNDIVDDPADGDASALPDAPLRRSP